MKSMARGALIIVEGCDRSGKTTFAKQLVSHLESQNIPAKFMNFPDRTTEIGKSINNYLQSKNHSFTDEAIHLLFSANRWEKVPEMKELLQSGTTLIIDRYAFSGVAFSAAKGLDLEWCKFSDVGLPMPDKVYYLDLDHSIQMTRSGFGEERYEVPEFQVKVNKVYQKIIDPTWEFLDASKSTREIISDISPNLFTLLKEVKDKNLQQLWKN